MLAAGANPLVAACARTTTRKRPEDQSPNCNLPRASLAPYGRLAMGGSSPPVEAS